MRRQSAMALTGREGARLIRRFHEATLSFGERRAGVRFVHDNQSGGLVLIVEPGALRSPDWVLHMPNESDCDLQVMGSGSRLDRPEACEACDRWMAYHGGTISGMWARMQPEGGKTAGAVFGAESMVATNPLGPVEWKLVRTMNARPEDVARACRRIAGVEVAAVRVVGVDPDGFDAKARFGIVRVEFPASAPDAAAVESTVERLLRGEAA